MPPLEHRLVIPEPVFENIQRMRYEGTEKIDHYLSLYLVQGGRANTIPLVRIPMGTSPGMTVTEDHPFLQTLGRFLDAKSLYAEVLLHFHPILGSSLEDAELMAARFRDNSRMSRYGIFVGPQGPTFYETDGREVFPTRLPVLTMPSNQFLRTQQQRLMESFSTCYRI